MKEHTYYVYIVTNPSKKSLYIGVTNNLVERLDEHYQNRGSDATWAGKYYCYKLIYYETFRYIDKAIEREKQLKGWSRIKKETLINKTNPRWNFLNDQFRRDPSVDPRSFRIE
ncbi:MAG TPA: GIY-YIG nuclease family protein [Saprospiraceae bacterium]|nr:GIY-YIG nuclease family protein [Saprospiraceae bacterium]